MYLSEVSRRAEPQLQFGKRCYPASMQAESGGAGESRTQLEGGPGKKDLGAVELDLVHPL